MVDEDVLRLLRVDVDPAGDDHEGLAVGQIQVAVGVDVPDIACGRPVLVLRVLSLAGLLRIVVVLEGHVLTFEEDLPDLADRQFLAVLVADVDDAEQWLADRTGMIERLLRTDERRAGGSVDA